MQWISYQFSLLLTNRGLISIEKYVIRTEMYFSLSILSFEFVAHENYELFGKICKLLCAREKNVWANVSLKKKRITAGRFHLLMANLFNSTLFINLESLVSFYYHNQNKDCFTCQPIEHMVAEIYSSRET